MSSSSEVDEHWTRSRSLRLTFYQPFPPWLRAKLMSLMGHDDETISNETRRANWGFWRDFLFSFLLERIQLNPVEIFGGFGCCLLVFYTCISSDKDRSRNFLFPPNNNRIIVRRGGGENNLIMATATANLTIDQAWTVFLPVFGFQ